MKKVYLIHGWGGSSKGGWFDWLKEELRGKAEVQAFDMPDSDNPIIERWVDFLENNIKKIDGETYFVGHSIGCQTIMRFLERLPERTPIGGCVFVAGWFNLMNIEDLEKGIAKPWLVRPIDFEKIKRNCDNFLVVLSDNDPFVPLSDAKIFKDKLGTKAIIKKNKGHFDFSDTDKIPEVLDFILK
jgi:predicted alpha/beta hydrolase family esterase